jgi:hypothetical protein
VTPKRIRTSTNRIIQALPDRTLPALFNYVGGECGRARVSDVAPPLGSRGRPGRMMKRYKDGYLAASVYWLSSSASIISASSCRISLA